MKQKIKGFKWNGFIQPLNQKSNTPYVEYKGNLYLELVLPNALKIDSFKKLSVRLEKWSKAHGGAIPNIIKITSRQMCQYKTLLKGEKELNSPTFNGLPIQRHKK